MAAFISSESVLPDKLISKIKDGLLVPSLCWPHHNALCEINYYHDSTKRVELANHEKG